MHVLVIAYMLHVGKVFNFSAIEMPSIVLLVLSSLQSFILYINMVDVREEIAMFIVKASFIAQRNHCN